METFNEILKIMGVLAIPSLLWNIFQYQNEKKIVRIEAEKELAKKRVDLSDMFEKHNQECQDLMQRKRAYEETFRGAIFITNTEEQNFDEEFLALSKRQNGEMQRTFADITYHEKLLGERPILFNEWGKIDSFKWKVKTIIKRIFIK